jgi:hypothetical protein
MNIYHHALLMTTDRMCETTTLVLNTEINVQLGEFTIKKHMVRALEQAWTNNPDFQTVFKDMPFVDVLQW